MTRGNKTPRRSGEAQAAQHRKAGPMKHRLQPRGGSQKLYLADDDYEHCGHCGRLYDEHNNEERGVCANAE